MIKLILLIGPTGFRDTEIILTNKRRINLLEYTRGEGQALQFNLVKADCSNEFGAALKDGRVIEHYGNKSFKVIVEKK